MLKGEKYFPGTWKWSFSINLPFACCFTKIQSDTKQTPEFHTKEGGKIHPSGLGTAASGQRGKGPFHQGTCQHPHSCTQEHTKKQLPTDLPKYLNTVQKSALKISGHPNRNGMLRKHEYCHRWPDNHVSSAFCPKASIRS